MNFKKKIFATTCLVVSLLLLFYIFFRSEVFWEGEKRDYYANYYIATIVLTLFSIITFYINDKIKTYLSIVTTTIVLTLYTIEGYLIFYPPTVNGDIGILKVIKKKNIYEAQTGKQYDFRYKLKVYEDLKKENKKVFLSILPKYFEEEKIQTLSGISKVETLFCNENGYYSMYKSDRYGFNNPDTEWDQKNVEFLLIGDSFVHGQCVNPPHDLTSVLRILSKKSALSLGYRSTGTLKQYAILKEYLKPGIKNILWVYFENSDINDLALELKSPILLNYLDNSSYTQNLISKQKTIDRLLKDEMKKRVDSEKSIKFLKLYRLRSTLSTKIFLKTSKNFSVQPEFKYILNQANILAKKNNSKLHFVYLPHYARYKFDYVDPNYQTVKKIIDEMDIPFIDIHKELFEKEKNPLDLFPFQMYGHYTVEGYKKVSEKIYQAITK
jgi:hypothetical protein